MEKTRCVGLIGGLAVGATVQYYREIANACKEQGKTLDLVMAHAETARVFEYVGRGDRSGLAEYFSGFADRLQAAGAEVLAITAVTAHFAIQELMARCALPVLDIFDPLREELANRSARRVAVFGTRFVIESGLFGFVPGVEVVRPSAEETHEIHSRYVDLAARGHGTEQDHARLTSIGQTLIERESLDAIVLAGTDLALVFGEGNTSFPYVDCAALHIRAIVAAIS